MSTNFWFSGPSMPDAILDLFKTAWRSYDEDKNYMAAMALAEIVLASNDGNYPVFVLMRAHLLVARCLAESEQPDEAEARISEGLLLAETSTEPVTPERLLLLGERINLFFKLNRRNAAWAAMKETLQIAENCEFAGDAKFRLHVLAPTYYNLAILAFEHDFYQEAARCYEMASEIWQITPPEDAELAEKARLGLQAARILLLENNL